MKIGRLIRIPYFGLSSAFVYLSAFQDPVEGKAAVLVDGRKGVKIQMSAPGARDRFGNCY